MSTLRHLSYFYVFFLLSISSCMAHEDAIVEHHDYMKTDQSLTLSALIDSTLEHFPDKLLNSAREQQANALQQRGDSWLSAASVISLRYQDDLVGDDSGLREIESALQLSLWNWGQRDAGQALAKSAFNAAEKNSSAIKLAVAGLVRSALWNMELENIRYQQAKSVLEISKKLLDKINRRVELGDLPRSDLLLAQSEYLQQRSVVLKTEAEMMHARKTYMSLTQSNIIPTDYTEPLSPLTEVPENHPQLSAINADIERKQAQVKWVKAAGSGQPNLILGGKSEKGGETQNDIESMSVGISIPFGGSAQRAPQVASANLNLTQALVQRAHLYRALEKRHHEAKHALEVTRTELNIANDLKQIAEVHLKMSQLSFSTGEINLMDLLKIQARSNNAIRHAKEQAVMLQKNIALYNQSVGVLP